MLPCTLCSGTLAHLPFPRHTTSFSSRLFSSQLGAPPWPKWPQSLSKLGLLSLAASTNNGCVTLCNLSNLSGPRSPHLEDGDNSITSQVHWITFNYVCEGFWSSSCHYRMFVGLNWTQECQNIARLPSSPICLRIHGGLSFQSSSFRIRLYPEEDFSGSICCEPKAFPGCLGPPWSCGHECSKTPAQGAWLGGMGTLSSGWVHWSGGEWTGVCCRPRMILWQASKRARGKRCHSYIRRAPGFSPLKDKWR